MLLILAKYNDIIQIMVKLLGMGQAQYGGCRNHMKGDSGDERKIAMGIAEIAAVVDEAIYGQNVSMVPRTDNLQPNRAQLKAGCAAMKRRRIEWRRFCYSVFFLF